MQSKLIVEFDNNILQGFNYLPVIWAASFFWIMFVCQWGNIGRFIQFFFILFDVLILIAATYTYFLVKNPEPAAIIDSSGMWVKHYGHIPGGNIACVGNYQWRNSPFVKLGVSLKDVETVRKQSSMPGKWEFFGQKFLSIRRLSLAILRYQIKQ